MPNNTNNDLLAVGSYGDHSHNYSSRLIINIDDELKLKMKKFNLRSYYCSINSVACLSQQSLLFDKQKANRLIDNNRTTIDNRNNNRKKITLDKISPFMIENNYIREAPKSRLALMRKRDTNNNNNSDRLFSYIKRALSNINSSIEADNDTITKRQDLYDESAFLHDLLLMDTNDLSMMDDIMNEHVNLWCHTNKNNNNNHYKNIAITEQMSPFPTGSSTNGAFCYSLVGYNHPSQLDLRRPFILQQDYYALTRHVHNKYLYFDCLLASGLSNIIVSSCS